MIIRLPRCTIIVGDDDLEVITRPLYLDPGKEVLDRSQCSRNDKGFLFIGGALVNHGLPHLSEKLVTDGQEIDRARRPVNQLAQHAISDQAVSAHHCQQLVVQGFHHIAQLFVGLSKRLTESFFSNKRRRG